MRDGACVIGKIASVTSLSYPDRMSIALPSAGSKAPSWALFARELASALDPWRILALREAMPQAAAAGSPVLVIPGFLASDDSTRALRRGLRQAGFRAHGWKRGRNLGLRPDIFETIDARVRHISRGAPVSIVGWSLGGLVAREYAKRAPDRISKVVTLGAPVCGDPRQNNNVWRLYELIAGHSVDAPPILCALEEKPPVETIALWSRRDGIVAAESASATGCCDRSIEIACGHIEMAFAPEAIAAVVAALR